jgi:hypothetical protein
MPETLAELRAREEEVGREWERINDTLNTIAGTRAEQGDAAAFRILQRQAMEVGQRRIELRMKMAKLEMRVDGDKR